ncbi:MAG: A/G-specific adenine glycosylase [Longimicrobiales bacterium]|nr:A/G-specific adenine glycosylase [Longimicrobiales bacterium]
MADALLRHFDAHQRSMPWRETSDPYAIWVSEVMLQQTRVDTVIPYWERWLDRFPTVDHLAEADLDDVLKEWEGLGYYSRARNLHRAACMVRERFDGRVPETVDTLRELPGVGEYTAGAVASIAYGVPTPAVDGNVRRVLARLYDLERPTPGELRQYAAELVPADRPGDFNQALMELGATVCTPRSPSCGVCPLAEQCEARRLGVQEQRPLPRPRKRIPEETIRTAVLVRGDGAMLVSRRPEDGLLGGLWEFPGVRAGEPWAEPIAGWLDAAAQRTELDAVRHAFSHKRVTYRPELSVVPDRAEYEPEDDTLLWAGPGLRADLAMPVAQQKIAAAARAHLEASGAR